MEWKSPADAMPWVGLYDSLASLICILAMAADVFHGFRQRKLWFPCRFFTMNAASITLIAIAMKLPVDLTTGMSDSKFVSIIFLVTMVANFLPSLGLMNDNELVMNITAFGILIITITMNVWIQFSTKGSFTTPIQMLILIFHLPCIFSVALTVPASRRNLQNRYNDLHMLGSNQQEINFSFKELKSYVKKYWMMTETGNSQFAIACSPVCSAFGVTCSVLAVISSFVLMSMFVDVSHFRYGKSDYQWSVDVIVILQSIGSIVGSIAPVFRCLSATSHFNISKKWSKNHLNVFKVEKHWIERLQRWKRIYLCSHIPGRHFKKVFHIIKIMILNVCIALQITVVIICNTICLIPGSLMILFSCFWYFFKLTLKRIKVEPNASNSNMMSDMEDYTGYILQIESEVKLSNIIVRNALNSITRLLQEYEEKEPTNLINLLKKSRGFNGIIEFDSDQVPPLHLETGQNCWSLVAVTLTSIALALPTNASNHVKGLLAGMMEGLQLVRYIEKSLNVNVDLVKARKAARHVWTDIEIYGRWLQLDLQKKARKGRTSKEILQWLGDEAAKFVIQFKIKKNASLDHSIHKFIAASSMYRISQTVLLHCKEKENWPTNEELFEFISTMIADLLCACFTNLPHVITMTCHEDAIEKREDSIRNAARVLGKSKKILKILKARQLPKLDIDSMAYIDKWHELPRSQIPNGCSSARI